MANETVNINGTAYGWNDVRITFLGRVLQGVSKIMYADAQEKTNNRGAGKFSVTRGRGAYTAEASITLKLEEIQAIQAAIGPGKKFTDIAPFEITVVYVNEANRKIVDIIKSAEFLNNGREINTGDSDIEREFGLIVSEIVNG